MPEAGGRSGKMHLQSRKSSCEGPKAGAGTGERHLRSRKSLWRAGYGKVLDMDKKLQEVIRYLREYRGRDLNIMEVCGSHTGAIAKFGISGMLSEHIHLLSGPGCPVCVTPTAYVDRMIDLSLTPGTVVATFGDLLRVPGSRSSLSEAKGQGGQVQMVYSPFDIIELAKKYPGTQFVFAAVGFETTAPVYALMAEQILADGIRNVKMLTAIKTMPQVISALMDAGAPVDGFIAPGHVSVVTGSKVWEPLAEKYGIPFGVAGFRAPEILAALYGIVRTCEGRGSASRENSAAGKGESGGASSRAEMDAHFLVMNFYPSVVSHEGNVQAQEQIAKVFEPGDAVWRGLGNIPGSGLYLNEKYREVLDAGSRGLNEDRARNRACRCAEVLCGKIAPTACPLYGRVCTPLTPQGACMVSPEGSCRAWQEGGRLR